VGDVTIEEREHEEQTSAGNLLDSRTSILDDQLNDRLEDVFDQPTSRVILHELAKVASQYDAIDLGHAASRLPTHARVVLFENLPKLSDKITFLVNTTSSTRTSILRHLDNKSIKDIIEGTPSDEVVHLLEDLHKRRWTLVLDLVESEKAKRILDLLTYDVYTAGRIMTNEMFVFYTDTTIAEVALDIRNRPGIDLTRRIFVLNDEEQLVGFVSARMLIINNEDLPIKKVMRSIMHKVKPDASRDEVVDLVERYKIPALPVVDDENHLLGVIAYEDVVEIMEDIADETIASFAGTTEDLSEHEPIFKRCIWRSPFLLVTLCSGLTQATILSFIQGSPRYTFLPYFVPLITGISGTVSIQASTLLVRAMSTGEMSRGTQGETVRRELLIGVMMGAVFGILCGAVVAVFNAWGIQDFDEDPFVVGGVISCGVFGAILMASFLGVMFPLIVSRFRIDPAIAAGPIAIGFNDVLSTIIFIFVTWIVTIALFQLW
jgi:magnesium transporter